MEQQVLAGAEPFRMEGSSEVGVLVSHGFTGTPQSVRPLGEALADAGFTVSGPRLAGHGTSVEDMARSAATDWLASLYTELAWLRERTTDIFVAGLSMGGMFSLYLAGMHPDLIRGIVPVNGCVFMRQPGPRPPRLRSRRPADRTRSRLGHEGRRRGVSLPRGPRPRGKALRLSYEGNRGAAASGHRAGPYPPIFRRPRRPAGQWSRTSWSRLGSEDKELVRLENSYHVATLDNDADLIAERTVRFVRDHAGVSRAGRRRF